MDWEAPVEKLDFGYSESGKPLTMPRNPRESMKSLEISGNLRKFLIFPEYLKELLINYGSNDLV